MDRIHVVTYELEDKCILMPNIVIAEVIVAQKILADHGDNFEISRGEGFLGYINWRDLKIPMIDLYSIVFGSYSDHACSDKYMLILNYLLDAPGIKFFGISLNTLPKLSALHEGDLQGFFISDIESIYSEGAYKGQQVNYINYKILQDKIGRLLSVNHSAV